MNKCSLPTCYALQRRRLLERHGYRIVRDEDGSRMYCPKKVKKTVRRQLAKLAKLEDMALGRKPLPDLEYWLRYNSRGQSYSARTMQNWYAQLNKGN